MSGAVAFSFGLTGTGWAAGEIAIGDLRARATASYLSDALGELIRAVQALVEGAETTRASWDEEPGEYRWIFERTGADVRVRLLEFPELWSDASDEKGESLLDATCSVRDLARAIASGAQNALDQLGADGYQQKWVQHPFPARDLAALQQLL